jgi:hypothetical protein
VHSGWITAAGFRAWRESYEAARVSMAASWLQELAADHGLVLAVTHASIRGRLARRLVRDGWRAEPGRRSLAPWSAWYLQRRRERP